MAYAMLKQGQGFILTCSSAEMHHVLSVCLALQKVPVTSCQLKAAGPH